MVALMRISASTICEAYYEVWDSPSEYEGVTIYSEKKVLSRESICNATATMRNPTKYGRFV